MIFQYIVKVLSVTRIVTHRAPSAKLIFFITKFHLQDQGVVTNGDRNLKYLPLICIDFYNKHKQHRECHLSAGV